jgi:signal transduction histidine kinase
VTPAVRWRPGGLLARTGTRLALFQSLVVVLAFVMAGYISQFAIARISHEQMRKAVEGEVRSLEVEYQQFGSSHLPQTVARRSRLWRGFDYRWTSPDGRSGVGVLPATRVSGWATVRRDPSDRRSGSDRFLVLTERLPDGAALSVGQNLSAADNESAAVSRSLIVSGLLGVGFCLTASYLFSRGTWRRIDDLARLAKAVAGGQLDARVSTHGVGRDDLDELGGAFNLMLERLEALIAQVRQVSSDIAHDLRTPLTRVRQRLDQLRRLDDDGPARRLAITRIEADLDDLLGMFSALLRLAEIESDSAGDRDDRFDLVELARHVADTYTPDIEACGRVLTVELEPAIICGDARLITQAIANLLDNAIRHTPARTPISIRTGLENGAPILSVTDRGPGVPAEYRELVLQRYRRLDSSRGGKGSGLGLALVAAIARRHQARLTLTDAAPGLTVTLIFAVHLTN